MSDEEVIDPIQALVRDITLQGATIHKKITHGKISYSLYSDYFEIANYQLASLDSIELLANDKRYREAFILLRTSFENMMIFKLMARGSKYFLLFKKAKKDTDEQAIKKLNDQIANTKGKGEKTSALKAGNYPRDGIVQVVYEGPYVDGAKRKGNLVPYYLELYKNFDPEAAFLEENDYFNYLPAKFRRGDIGNKRKAENKYLYTHYMSYRALIHSLKLNRLYTAPQIARLEAHYNYLSEFVHPTKKSIDKVKVQNRHNSYIGSLDEIREYYPSLRLLSTIYAGYIAASFAEDLLFIIQGAPKKYIAGFDPSELRASLDSFYKSTDYFWFIQNLPHDYDKFDYCVHHADPKALGGDYKKIDPKKVTFKKEILGRFTRMQMGWENKVWGKYIPPFSLTKLKW